MTNIITSRRKLGKILTISGRYKMDTPDGVGYARTIDLWLHEKYKTIPTVVASVHHVNTPEHLTMGNFVPFVVCTTDVEIYPITPENPTYITRIMVGATNISIGIISEYEYWCEYIIMGETL